MKVTIANPSSGKTYQKELEAGQEKSFLGKRIGAEVKLDNLGLAGVEAVVTGGSDKQGFPMRRDIEGSGRKKVLLTKGIGFRGKVTKKKGEKKTTSSVAGLRRRKTVRGNTVSDEIMQVNLKVTKNADKLAGFLEVKEEPKKDSEEEKKE